MARDYNADYDKPENTWDVYYKQLQDDGMTDDQIESELSGTKWNTPGSKYAGWANGIKAKRDTIEARDPEAEQLIKTQTREQFANDNDAYRSALASKGVTPGNSTGKVRSIQQAYYDGNIDKGTRDYMMADAIAKFARNTGRDIGNIGAQYTGGAINNNYEEADWNKRNDELFKQQTSAEAGTIANSDKAMERRQQEANLTGKGLENEKADRSLNFSRKLQALAEEAYNKGNTKLGNVLSYAASKGATSLSYDEPLIALLKELLDPEVPEVDERTFEQFQKDNPDWTQEEFNELQKLKRQARDFGDDNGVAVKRYVNKINGEHEDKRKAAKKRQEEEEKAAKKAKAEEEKAAKKQQKKEEEAAKIKSGYINSYDNMVKDWQAGNKHALGQQWNNLAKGRNPFDGHSWLTDEQHKALDAIQAKVKEEMGSKWQTNDAPSDLYMIKVLRGLAQSL